MAEDARGAGTRRLVGEIYGEYCRGNRGFLLDLLADDVTWISAARGDVPWSGERRGRAGVEAYFAALDKLVSVTAYEVEQIIVEGETAVVLARGTGRFHATGEVVSLAKADVMRVRDGRVVEFREYYDSAPLLDCIGRCGGQPG